MFPTLPWAWYVTAGKSLLLPQFLCLWKWWQWCGLFCVSFWDLKGIHGNEVVGTWEEVQGGKISICITDSFVLATDYKIIDSTVLSCWGCHYVLVHRIVGKKFAISYTCLSFSFSFRIYDKVILLLFLPITIPMRDS